MMSETFHKHHTNAIQCCNIYTKQITKECELYRALSSHFYSFFEYNYDSCKNHLKVIKKENTLVENNNDDDVDE